MLGDTSDFTGGSVGAGREVLPTDLKAVHYDLTLEPDFKNFTFDGRVRIE